MIEFSKVGFLLSLPYAVISLLSPVIFSILAFEPWHPHFSKSKVEHHLIDLMYLRLFEIFVASRPFCFRRFRIRKRLLWLWEKKVSSETGPFPMILPTAFSRPLPSEIPIYPHQFNVSKFPIGVFAYLGSYCIICVRLLYSLRRCAITYLFEKYLIIAFSTRMGCVWHTEVTQ